VTFPSFWPDLFAADDNADDSRFGVGRYSSARDASVERHAGADESTPASRSADTFIVDQVRDGNADVFSALFLDYHKRLWAFAYDLTGSVDTAHEVVQEVFTTLWTRRIAWTVTHSIAEYLFGAVRNTVYKLRRHRAIVARTERVAEADDSALTFGSLPVDPLIAVEYQDTVARLEVRIARMPVGRRTALLLRWREQLSYDEIAAIMGVSTKAVSVQLARAREELRAVVRLFHD
jgi:RNA polymerase sigma-70 factor (ECF subfamily)